MELSLYRNQLTKKLFLIYGMNAVDWICTVILLKSGDFYEANPLARLFIDSLPIGFIVKCVLPMGLILGITVILRLFNGYELRSADQWISFMVVFYLAIDLDHVINFFILNCSSAGRNVFPFLQ